MGNLGTWQQKTSSKCNRIQSNSTRQLKWVTWALPKNFTSRISAIIWAICTQKRLRCPSYPNLPYVHCVSLITHWFSVNSVWSVNDRRRWHHYIVASSRSTWAISVVAFNSRSCTGRRALRPIQPVSRCLRETVRRRYHKNPRRLRASVTPAEKIPW